MKVEPLPIVSRSAALLLAALLPAALAQPAPTPSPNLADDDEVVMLSPFIVSTSEAEDGYMARYTTSANRTKTDLRDVGASIDVLTDSFLNDVGALNMNDALRYVANMSVYEGADTDLTNSSQWFDAPYNSRGFRSATTLVDFFPQAVIPIDRYNTESLTMLKGSNAILFGIGSPGGSINTSFKRPHLNRNNFTIAHTTDTNDSQRGEFDVNRVLIRNKLAIRIAGLSQEWHTFKEPSLDRRRGLYGAVTYRPFEKTLITVTLDDGKRNRFLELNNIVLDSYTPWVAAGKPTINWQTRGNPANTGAPEANDAVGVAGIDRLTTAPLLVYVEGQGTMNWRYMGESRKQSNGAERIAFTPQNNILYSPDGKEWRLDLTTNVWGNMNYHTTVHRSKSIFINQNILEGLDIELAANQFDVEYDSDAAGWANRPEIQADPNELLPDGTPNPNVGKPYIEADRHRNDTERREFDNMRATVAYDFSLDDIKIFRNIGLGRYKLLGLWENQELDVYVATGEQINMTPLPGFSAALNNSQNQIRRRYYFEPNETVYGYDGPLVGRNIGAGITPGWGITGTVRRSRQETESLVGSIQGQWWQAESGFYRIIGLYGERHEKFTQQAKTFTRDANGLFPGDFRNWNDATGGGTWSPSSTRKPQTKTYSLVVRPLENVSVFYNFSDIFNTADVNFRDVYNQPLRPVFGDTTDYGVRVDLFNQRMSVSLAKFETRQVDQNSQVNGNIWTWSNEIWTALDMLDRFRDTTFRTYRDDVTDGYELTLTGRITDNWDVRISAGKRNTIIGSFYEDVQSWVDENWALWQQNAAVETGNTSRPTVGVAASEIARVLSDLRAQVGLRQTGQREYNIRFNSSYRFLDGFLKGFTAGGGFVWDSENILGFERLPNGVLNTQKPYVGQEMFSVDANFGYTRKLFNDRVTWDIRLNIYNLLDEGGPLHRYAIDSGIDNNRLVTERYMIAPRTFQLRNTFSF